MSHPLLSNLPSTARPGPSTAGHTPPASARAPSGDDGFARALEQRMSTPGRAPARAARETGGERPPERASADKAQQAERRPAADGARDDPQAPRDSAATAPAKAAKDETPATALPRDEAETETEAVSEAASGPAGGKAAMPAAYEARHGAHERIARAVARLPAATADAATATGASTPAREAAEDAAPSAEAAAAAAAVLAGSLPFIAAAHAPLAGADDAAAEQAAGGDGRRRPVSLALERLLGDLARHKAQAGGQVAEYEGAAAHARVKAEGARAVPAQAMAAAPAGAPPAADAAAALAPHASDGQPPLMPAVAALQPGVRAEQGAVPQLAVSTPAGQRGWAEEVGNRVTWMLGRNDAKAELVLTPPNLGKVEVSIQITGDQTTAHFVAASAAARDALEQALPRLRELLQQAGISLGQANVSTSGEQQTGQDGSSRPGRARGRADAAADPAEGVYPPVPAGGWPSAGSGMVDTFA